MENTIIYNFQSVMDAADKVDVADFAGIVDLTSAGVPLKDIASTYMTSVEVIVAITVMTTIGI